MVGFRWGGGSQANFGEISEMREIAFSAHHYSVKGVALIPARSSKCAKSHFGKRPPPRAIAKRMLRNSGRSFLIAARFSKWATAHFLNASRWAYKRVRREGLAEVF